MAGDAPSCVMSRPPPVPTEAEPVPEPVDVKYANAAVAPPAIATTATTAPIFFFNEKRFIP